MKEAGCHMFCEVEDAARILGAEVGRVVGWLDGGRLKGTYVRSRWLAEISSVLRLHREFVADHRSLPRSGDRQCDRISELNRRMHTDEHTPRKARIERSLISEIEALCIVAPPGLRPPPPRKKTAGENLEARQRVDARMRAREKERVQRENARTYDSFRKNLGDKTPGAGRSIADKRFWWNEE